MGFIVEFDTDTPSLTSDVSCVIIETTTKGQTMNGFTVNNNQLDPNEPLDADTVEALGLDPTGQDVGEDEFPYTIRNLPVRPLVALGSGDRYYREAMAEIERRLLLGK